MAFASLVFKTKKDVNHDRPDRSKDSWLKGVSKREASSILTCTYKSRKVLQQCTA